jgi:hypothetical protein
MAAWFAATAARRKASRSDPANVSHGKTNTQGMSDNDYRYMQEYMSHVMNGEMTQEQANKLESMVRALKVARKPIELPDLGENGDSEASAGVTR